MVKITDILKRGARLRIGLPFISYEVALDDLAAPETVDVRIARLGAVKRDLEAAIAAVQALQEEAQDRKTEAEQLQTLIARLQQDKKAAESLLEVPEESFVRLVGRATFKGRVRGRAEGVIIGLTTGLLSSALVWYLTR